MIGLVEVCGLFAGWRLHSVSLIAHVWLHDMATAKQPDWRLAHSAATALPNSCLEQIYHLVFQDITKTITFNFKVKMEIA